MNYKKNEKSVGEVRGTLTLFQGVLNDDFVEILRPQYSYTIQNGKFTICKLVYYTFANEWSNREHTVYFANLESALDWYRKNFLERVILQGACWIGEDIRGCEEDKQSASIVYKIEKDFSSAIESLTEEEKEACISEWESLTVYCELE